MVANTSDKRLKTNIVNIDSPLEKLSKINGVYFNWNELAEDKDQTLREAGVLAQEIEEVLPTVNVVATDAEIATACVYVPPTIPVILPEVSTTFTASYDVVPSTIVAGVP